MSDQTEQESADEGSKAETQDTEKTAKKERVLTKEDRVAIDSVDQLPLSVVPLKSNMLRQAKLMKSANLETVLEIYNDPLSGSLQIPADDKMIETLGLQEFDGAEHDKAIVLQLAKLNSFDVYSMRSSLRRIGLDLDISDRALQLSEDMKRSLRKYARSFTVPLLKSIYGAETSDLEDLDGDLTRIFANPDKALVKQNLFELSKNTGINIQDIPAFIEDYSEVYQSVSYYRCIYDAIRSDIDRFLIWIETVIDHKDTVNAPQTREVCQRVERDMRYILQSLAERFEAFRYSFEKFWEDINANSFEKLRRDVSENYETLGHVLCAVVVKINAWSTEFPSNDTGSPNRRAKFTMTQIAPGIARVRHTEEEARVSLGMSI